jgi:hypothetical protein
LTKRYWPLGFAIHAISSREKKGHGETAEPQLDHFIEHIVAVRDSQAESNVINADMRSRLIAAHPHVRSVTLLI